MISQSAEQLDIPAASGRISQSAESFRPEPVYRTVGEQLKGVYPVSTGLVATGQRGWVVEVGAIDVIPDAK